MSAAIRNNKNINSTKKTPAGLQDNNPSRRTPAWRSNSNPPPSVYAPPPSNNPKPQQQPHAQFPPLGNSNNPTSTPSPSLNPASPPATASFAHSSPSSPPPSSVSAAATAPDIPLPPPSLIGQIIIVTTRTGQRYQGALVAVPSAADAEALIQLKDVQDLASATPANIIKETFSLPVGSIVHWSNPSSASSLKISLNGNSSEFRIDGDITQAASNVNVRRFISNANGATSSEGRELQAWQPDSSAPYAINPFPSNSHLRGDEATFGPGANAANGSWDQFAANERMFGVKTSFNEELYTTKLDRSTPDFKERERKAMAIAQEIMSSGTANPHIAEERNMTTDDSGANEEDKYAGVNRSANAYIPPGRRSQQPVTQQTNSAQNLSATSKPSSPPPVTSEVPKVSLSSDGTGATTLPSAAASGGTSPTPTPSPSASANASSPSNRPPADLTSTFRDFVAGEKQRLTQKRAAIVKSEMDKRMSELVKFSKDFKLNKPIPEDLLKIIAKDETKQQQIRDKAAKDAGSAAARSITGTAAGGAGVGIGAGPRVVVPVGGATNTVKKTVALAAPANTSNPAASPPNNSGINAVAASATTSPSITNATSTATSTSTANPLASTATATATKRTRIPMVISPIPPFNPHKLRGPAAIAQAEKEKKDKDTLAAGAAPSDVSSGVTSPTAGTATTAALPKLNINAPAFKLKPGAPAFKPSTPTATPSPSLPSVSTPSNQVSSSSSSANAFFGTRVIKKGAVVHVKDDFNPFKTGLIGGKGADAAAVSFTWPFSGKRFMLSFPNLPPPPSGSAPGGTPGVSLHHPSLVHPHTPMSPGAPMVSLGMGVMGGMPLPPGGQPVVMPNMSGAPNMPVGVSGVPGVPGMNMNVTMIPPGTPSLAAASVSVTTPVAAVGTGNGVPGTTPGSGANSQGPITGSVPPPSNVMNVVGLPNQQSPPSGAAPPPGPPGPPGPPPPSSYDDDQHRAAVAAAAAAYGMVYYPPPYGYAGQPLLPPGAPPGSYIPSHYLPPMHYPHMSHNGHPMYAHGPPPTMGGIPPHQQYMHHPPPPGAYPAPPPPPNGTGRGSMPPTPMPPHAHPYYHPSPQISHAVPYSMMMPPPPGTNSPGAPPLHSYDTVHNPQQQVPMNHS